MARSNAIAELLKRREMQSPFRDDHESEHTHPRLQRRQSEIQRGFHLSTTVTVGDDLETPHKRSPGVKASASSTPHVIAMVGLPARGKTYISKKMARYLNWIGMETKVFNLGDYRRVRTIQGTKEGRERLDRDHQFFDHSNPEGMRIREEVCKEALEDVFAWLAEGGEVAVFDATNTTRQRRELLHSKVVTEMGYKLFFVESICEDKATIEANIREVKVTSPDYVAMGDKNEAVNDFKKRIAHYEDQYQTLDETLEPDLSFLKIFNCGKKVSVYQHEGHIQSRIVYFLMNLHLQPRTIYLCRHGQSEYNAAGRLGGDSGLTECGRQYSRKLGQYINSLQDPSLVVWTSWLRRTVETAQHIKGRQERWKTLNEIDAGDCSGLTMEEIKAKFPKELQNRDKDKFFYRYPNGESYEDLVARMEPVIMELERKETVVVVGHQAVLRCLLGYLLEVDEEHMPWLEVPLHTVMKLTPVAYGCKKEEIFLGPCCSHSEGDQEVPQQCGPRGCP